MVMLPVAVGGTATSWQLVDYVAPALRTQPAAGGVCSAQLPQLDPDELWLIDHAVIACTGTTATTLRLYADQVGPLYLLDGSDAGSFDVADWPAGLVLRPSTALLAVWSGASDGAIGTITLQARSLRRR